MRHEETAQFGIAFALLANGVGRAGTQNVTVRLPEFEEAFNLPAGASEGVRLVKGQVGNISQVDRVQCARSICRLDGGRWSWRACASSRA